MCDNVFLDQDSNLAASPCTKMIKYNIKYICFVYVFEIQVVDKTVFKNKD